jgi:hypothetical protein
MTSKPLASHPDDDHAKEGDEDGGFESRSSDAERHVIPFRFHSPILSGRELMSNGLGGPQPVVALEPAVPVVGLEGTIRSLAASVLPANLVVRDAGGQASGAEVGLLDFQVGHVRFPFS